MALLGEIGRTPYDIILPGLDGGDVVGVVSGFDNGDNISDGHRICGPNPFYSEISFDSARNFHAGVQTDNVGATGVFYDPAHSCGSLRGYFSFLFLGHTAKLVK